MFVDLDSNFELTLKTEWVKTIPDSNRISFRLASPQIPPHLRLYFNTILLVGNPSSSTNAGLLPYLVLLNSSYHWATLTISPVDTFHSPSLNSLPSILLPETLRFLWARVGFLARFTSFLFLFKEGQSLCLSLADVKTTYQWLSRPLGPALYSSFCCKQAQIKKYILTRKPLLQTKFRPPSLELKPWRHYCLGASKTKSCCKGWRHQKHILYHPCSVPTALE